LWLSRSLLVHIQAEKESNGWMSRQAYLFGSLHWWMGTQRNFISRQLLYIKIYYNTWIHTYIIITSKLLHLNISYTGMTCILHWSQFWSFILLSITNISMKLK
jgi:hypothetical protein